MNDVKAYKQCGGMGNPFSMVSANKQNVATHAEVPAVTSAHADTYTTALKDAIQLIPKKEDYMEELVEFTDKQYKGSIKLFEGNYYPHGYGAKTFLKSDHKISGSYIGTFNSGYPAGVGELVDGTKKYIGFFKKNGDLGMHVIVENGKNKIYKNGDDTITDQVLLKQLANNIENDVKFHSHAEEISGTALDTAIKLFIANKKTIAQNTFNESINKSSMTVGHTYGYVIDGTCKYYGNVINKNNKILAHGRGVMKCTENKKMGEQVLELNKEYYGTFCEGEFTGLGKIVIGENQQYGVFKKGLLNGMGMRNKEKQIAESGGLFKSESFNDANLFSDTFVDGEVNEKYITNGYRFAQDNKNKREIFAVPSVIMFYERGIILRGSDYYLVEHIKDHLIKTVDPYVEQAITAYGFGIQKEKEDKNTHFMQGVYSVITEKRKKEMKAENVKKVEASITEGAAFEEAQNNFKKTLDAAIVIDKDGKLGTLYEAIVIDETDKNGKPRKIEKKKLLYQGYISSNNLPHSVGTKKTEKGLYEGSFVQGKMDGLGQLTYYTDGHANGRVFKGFFKDDKPSGWGQLTDTKSKTVTYSDKFVDHETTSDKKIILSDDERKALQLEDNIENVVASQNSNKAKDDTTGNAIALNNSNNVREKILGDNKFIVLFIRKQIGGYVDEYVKKVKEITKDAENEIRLQNEKIAKNPISLKQKDTVKQPNDLTKFTFLAKNINVGSITSITNESETPSDKIILYEECGYKGTKWSVENGKIDVSKHAFKSIKVPKGLKAIAINNDKKSEVEFTEDTECITEDKFQSIVSGADDVADPISINAHSEPSDKIILYENCNYKGNKWPLEDGTTDLSKHAFESIKVPKGLKAIAIKNDGVVEFTKDTECIQDKFQSIKSASAETDNGYDPISINAHSEPPSDKIILYEFCNYTGNKWSLEDGTTDVFKHAFKSIKVPKGLKAIAIKNDGVSVVEFTENTKCIKDKFKSIKSATAAGTYTGYDFKKISLMSAAAGLGAAGLYYAYTKYNERSNKSKKRSRRSDKSDKNAKKSAKKRGKNSSETKRSENKRSEKKRSQRRRRSA